MRDLAEELKKLIEFATKNHHIRAMVLQGSYVNPEAPIDRFSDLDPLFYVDDLTPFIETNDWKNYFGNPISCFHDEGENREHKWYTRLTIYSDGFKIDFGFQLVQAAIYANDMPLYRVYVDKDQIVPAPEVADERKFYIKRPTSEEVLERINTFFFDTSYVVKALIREEIFFEKYMEQVLKKKIHKLLEWYIGYKHHFHVNTGVVGRYFKRYLTKKEWNMLLDTYPNAEKSSCIASLFSAYRLVRYLGTHLAKEMDFEYPEKHEKDMLAYCKKYLKEEGNS